VDTDGDTIGNSVIYDNGTNVGIGLTPSTAKLEVLENLYVKHPNAEELTFRVDNYGTTGTDAGAVLRLLDQVGNTTVNIDSRSGSTRHTYFNNGGNVGIGTSSPAYPLEIYDGASRVIRAGASFISIDSTGSASSPSLIFEGDADTGFWHPASNTLAISTGGTERMRIATFGDISFRDTSANQAFYWDASAASLGINTTSPEQNLHIEGAALTVNRANDDSSVSFKNSANNATWRIGRDYSNAEAFTFAYSASGYPSLTGNSIAVIDTNGNVGIGTSSPDLPIYVNKSSTTSGDMLYLKNLRYGSTDSSGLNSIVFGWNNHVAAKISANKESVNRTGFIITGEAGYNIPTEIARFLSTGGITFNGDTSPANALDDYEEGTISATVEGITATTNTVTGTYTKIGNLVTVHCYVVITGKSGGSGNPYLNLPFTADGTGISLSKLGGLTSLNTIISGLEYMGLYGSNGNLYANNSSGAYIGQGSWTDGELGVTITYRAL